MKTLAVEFHSAPEDLDKDERATAEAPSNATEIISGNQFRPAIGGRASAPASTSDEIDGASSSSNMRSIPREPDSSLKDALIAMVPALRGFAFSLCGNFDRADDLVQETILKAWQNLHRFEEGTNLRAWLFTILRNQYFSELRKRRREIEDADGKMVAALSVAPEQHGHLDMQDFQKALSRIVPEQREALILVAAVGMSYEEAAEVAQCAVGTIKSRVNRARFKLSELLGMVAGDTFGADAGTTAAMALDR